MGVALLSGIWQTASYITLGLPIHKPENVTRGAVLQRFDFWAFEDRSCGKDLFPFTLNGSSLVTAGCSSLYKKRQVGTVKKTTRPICKISHLTGNTIA